MEKRLKEGSTEFFTDSDENITADMLVFYNPVMKLNRDTTLAVLAAMSAQRASEKDSRGEEFKGLRIGLPMEASGIRAARILNELVTPGYMKLRFIALNDLSENAVQYAKRNVALYETNGDDAANVSFSQKDASVFMLDSVGFDYLDIDPFGTPNPFLDAAVQNITRGGVMAVTATDTSALAGTYPAATSRKYWAIPIRNWLMHEVGLRILIRKVQLVGAQYEKALVPILSISTDHYYRVFFRCERSHTDVKTVLQQHKWLRVCGGCMSMIVSGTNDAGMCDCGKEYKVAGPLWRGMLHNIDFVKQLRSSVDVLKERSEMKELETLLAIIEDECRIDSVGFIDLHELVSRLKIPAPRTADVMAVLGAHACRTHINGAGIKTDLSIGKLKEILYK